MYPLKLRGNITSTLSHDIDPWKDHCTCTSSFQVCRILLVDLLSMLTVWYLQFYQPMILTSIVVSFIPVAMASLQSQADRTSSTSILKNLGVAFLRALIVLALTLAVNTLLKVSFTNDVDQLVPQCARI